MVDLVFILLIFFLVSLTLQQPKIWELALSGGGTGQSQQPSMVIELSIDGPKSMGRQIDVQEMISVAKQRNAIIAIKPGPGVSWQQGAQLLARLKDSGVPHALLP